MNFRYHIIVFAFLAVAIHFSSSDGVGTASLAQQAAPVNQDDPNLKRAAGRTDGGNEYKYTIQEVNAADQDPIFGKPDEKRLVLRFYDNEGKPLSLFGPCENGCRSEFSVVGTIANLTNITELREAVATAKTKIDELAKKKKEDERIEAEKRAKCEGIKTAEETAKCLTEKIAAAKNETERRELKERLGELVQYGLETDPAAVIKYLTANKDIMKNILPAQAAEIRIAGGQYLAGKNAFSSASAIEQATERCYEAVSTIDYSRSSREQACNRARSAAIRANQSGYSAFNREFRAAFGISGNAGSSIREAWTNANYKHDRAISILRDPRLITAQNLGSIETMADENDTRPSINAALRTNILNVGGVDLDQDGNIDFRQNQQITNGAGRRSRQQQRRNNGIAFGGCNNDGIFRPGIVNCSFDDDPFKIYMDRLRQNTATFGNFGSSLSQTSPSTFQINNSLVTSGLGGGRGRPGA